MGFRRMSYLWSEGRFREKVEMSKSARVIMALAVITAVAAVAVLWGLPTIARHNAVREHSAQLQQFIEEKTAPGEDRAARVRQAILFLAAASRSNTIIGSLQSLVNDGTAECFAGQLTNFAEVVGRIDGAVENTSVAWELAGAAMFARTQPSAALRDAALEATNLSVAQKIVAKAIMSSVDPVSAYTDVVGDLIDRAGTNQRQAAAAQLPVDALTQCHA